MNGWSNIETYMVFTDHIEGLGLHDMGWDGLSVGEVAEVLKAYVLAWLDMTTEEGHAKVYAQHFVTSADYEQIAQLMLSEHSYQVA